LSSRQFSFDRFHASLRAGDSTGAAALLGPDVIVLESGDMEDRAAQSRHLMPFMEEK
jgi:hypothetical protein